MPFYLDSSAIVKLIMDEPESDAMEAWLASGVTVVTSQLAGTEVVRAVRRRVPGAQGVAQAVLAAFDTARLRVEEYAAAATLPPVEMRSLDALHLAVALTLRPELDGLVTYDEPLAAAAASLGVEVIAPGRPRLADG
ncbi:MAG: type II toxin-antitoxin system VapC family toxin [Bifidobacteriaceae bacterium]|jgi:predicted nucleic acid-binding protein|nr:type II toxin-antitoxin system VapC family toxin [Bifidobacteriaceae bacterium]